MTGQQCPRGPRWRSSARRLRPHGGLPARPNPRRHPVRGREPGLVGMPTPTTSSTPAVAATPSTAASSSTTTAPTRCCAACSPSSASRPPTEMSMSIRCEECGLEYAVGGRGLKGILAQPHRLPTRASCGCSCRCGGSTGMPSRSSRGPTIPTRRRTGTSKWGPRASASTSSPTTRSRSSHVCGPPGRTPPCSTRPATFRFLDHHGMLTVTGSLSGSPSSAAPGPTSSGSRHSCRSAGREPGHSRVAPCGRRRGGGRQRGHGAVRPGGRRDPRRPGPLAPRRPHRRRGRRPEVVRLHPERDRAAHRRPLRFSHLGEGVVELPHGLLLHPRQRAGRDRTG